MKHTHVEIKGLSPLLMHCWPMTTPAGADKLSPAEQAELAAYRDPDTRRLYVPAENIRRGLVAAGAFSRGKGRGSLQKIVAASTFVIPERPDLGVSTYSLDSRPVVIAATRGRIVRHRPRLDLWALRFGLIWDETLMTEEQLRRVVDDLGQRVGLLDFRPERKGPYGRFIVTGWQTDGSAET